MGLCFLFCHYSAYFISNIFIGQWCTVTIIAICYGSIQFCMVFISWSWHARLFVRLSKLAQEILYTSECVKIAHLIENWIIRNWRFLRICLILCVFFLFMFLLTHSDSLSSVELSSEMTNFDSSLYVEQICNTVLSTRNSFDLILSVEQTREIEICFVSFISVLTG